MLELCKGKRGRHDCTTLQATEVLLLLRPATGSIPKVLFELQVQRICLETGEFYILELCCTKNAGTTTLQETGDGQQGVCRKFCSDSI